MHAGVTGATGNTGRRVVAGWYGARHTVPDPHRQQNSALLPLELRFQQVLG
jgi:hypothetical protein